MTEQTPPAGPEEPCGQASADGDAPQDAAPVGDPTTTGVPVVDEVLADVDRLDELPLDEHLPAFERAHDSLRSALDAEPGDPD
jgi:hypothetical protein